MARLIKCQFLIFCIYKFTLFQKINILSMPFINLNFPPSSRVKKRFPFDHFIYIHLLGKMYSSEKCTFKIFKFFLTFSIQAPRTMSATDTETLLRNVLKLLQNSTKNKSLKSNLLEDSSYCVRAHHIFSRIL